MDDDIRALLSPESEAEYLRQQEIDDFRFAELQRRRRQLYPEPEKKQPQPKVRPGMTDADRDWVQHRLDVLARVIAQVMDERECELRRQIIARRDALYAEIKALKEQVAALRCDVEVLTKHKAAKSDVVPLRGRDVA